MNTDPSTSQVVPENINYSDFVERLKRFQRFSIISQARHGCWTVFEKASCRFENQKDEIDAMLVRAYAPRVAAIAASVCTDDVGIHANISDLIALCSSFLNIKGHVGEDERMFDSSGLKKILGSSEKFSGLLITDELVAILKIQTVMHRTMRAQWDFRNHTLDGIVRSWIVIEA